jgi:ribosomal protein S10
MNAAMRRNETKVTNGEKSMAQHGRKKCWFEKREHKRVIECDKREEMTYDQQERRSM